MRARLTIENGDASPPESLLDGKSIVKLGRNKANDLILRDKHASRFHAEIFRENGRWRLRDCGTTNGTRLNGQRITSTVVLEHGCEIRVGDVSIRFALEPSERPTDEIPLGLGEALASEPPAFEADETPELSTVHFEPDELTSLLSFMDASLREDTSTGVVKLALRTVHLQTQAAVCGFLSLDEHDPLPKMVLPSQSQVDVHLSRELTQRVQRDGKTAWLADMATQSSKPPTDSLISYSDALCVPVQTGGAPLGALHVYRSDSTFEACEVRFCEALAGYLARCLHVLRSRHALEADNSRLREHTSTAEPELIGESQPMKQLKQQIRRLAEGPKIVLVCGQSGSGKELVALALHRQSSRHEGPLVPVNCAAIAASMPEGELFGHCKGSFTGAVADRPGYFQQADMGTLFLDEIGELSEECQAKLLRVLESGKFRPVGGTMELKADVRIIAATNRDLKTECLEGNFRKDLFFRLGVEIKVPPLRDRREDIPALVAHFMYRLAAEYRRVVRLSSEALERLQEYHWPGNVRQLRSVLEHAIAMSEEPIIGADELHLFPEGPILVPEGVSLNLEELEQWAIRQALARMHGTIVQTAKLLGIHRDTLMAKMKKYGIENPKSETRNPKEM